MPERTIVLRALVVGSERVGKHSLCLALTKQFPQTCLLLALKSPPYPGRTEREEPPLMFGETPIRVELEVATLGMTHAPRLCRDMMTTNLNLLLCS